MSRPTLIEWLRRLLPGELDLVLAYLDLDPNVLPPPTAPKATRLLALLDFYRDDDAPLVDAIRLAAPRVFESPSTSEQQARTSASAPTQPMTARADVLLVVVTNGELDAVIAAAAASTGLTAPPLLHFPDRTYHDLGVLGGARVYVVQIEMGTATVGGSLSTIPTALNEVRPLAAIMVGIAFGVNPKVQPIGQILVSKQIVQYDVRRVGTAIDGTPEIIPRGGRASATPRVLNRLRATARSRRHIPTAFGLILSGESLVDNRDFRDFLRKQEPEALGGEMEGGGLFVAATGKGVEWCVVKAVCDYADGKKREDKAERQGVAARNAAEFIIATIEAGGFTREHYNSFA